MTVATASATAVSQDSGRSQENPRTGVTCVPCAGSDPAQEPAAHLGSWPMLWKSPPAGAASWNGLRAGRCEPHAQQTALKMFPCKEDGLIVRGLQPVLEHQAHSVVPMEDVAWDYKVGDGGQPSVPNPVSPVPLTWLSLDQELGEGPPETR